LVRLILASGQAITCTAEHRIRTWDGRWIQAATSVGESVCVRSSNGTGTNGTATQIPRTKPSAHILPVTSVLVESCGSYFCTELSGLRSMATSRNQWWSTILMAMRRTIRWATSGWSRRASTREYTRETSSWLKRRPFSGISRRRDYGSIASLGSAAGWTGGTSAECAISATKPITAEIQNPENFVLQNAGITAVLLAGSTTSSEPVSSAAKRIRSTSTRRRRLAPVAVAQSCVTSVVLLPNPVDVYCLATTDGTFYVNGVLVSNCDALRYMIWGAERHSGMKPSSTWSADPDRRRIGVQLDKAGQITKNRGHGNGNGNGSRRERHGWFQK
jgi:hypothetical protein